MAFLDGPDTDAQAPVSAQQPPAAKDETESDIRRKPRDLDEAAKQHIESWQQICLRTREYWSGRFETMREHQELARLGADKWWKKQGKYVANLMQRHVKQRAASLYAKNPRAKATLRPRLEYKVWDGNQQTLLQAINTLQVVQEQIALQPDPATAQMMAQQNPQIQNAMAIIQDVQEAQVRKTMLMRLGKTLEMLFHYFLDEQEPSFKTQTKQMVRRTVINSVGYVKVGFQRALEKQPEISSKIADVTDRIARIQALAADLQDDEIEEGHEEKVQELRIMLKSLQEKEEIVVREGLTFDFPRSTEILPDPKTRQLKGWVGTSFIIHEYMMTPDEIKKEYGVDIGDTFTAMTPKNPFKHSFDQNMQHNSWGLPDSTDQDRTKPKQGLALVWEVWDKETGTVFAMCRGYKDYLKDPEAPEVELERFFNIFALTFNDIEDEDEIFPESDVALLKDVQEEYNRSREALREHRRAGRPKWVMPRGKMEDEDKALLQGGSAFTLLELDGLAPGEKIGDVIQDVPNAGIDPNLYETSSLMDDGLRVTGSQEANFGGRLGRATATESAIAQGSQETTTSSERDELDDLLTELARASGQILLQHMSVEMVQEIVGPGFVRPEFTREDIAKEIFLTIEAGSSGRPNKELELANMERVGPILLQVPGVSPHWLAKSLIEKLDDQTIDLSEAIIEGAPSMVALNAAQRTATGDPTTDPAQQGTQGSNNGPRGEERESRGQPAFPTGQQ